MADLDSALARWMKEQNPPAVFKKEEEASITAARIAVIKRQMLAEGFPEPDVDYVISGLWLKLARERLQQLSGTKV